MTALEELELKQEQLAERISLVEDIIHDLETNKEERDQPLLYSYYSEIRDLQFQYKRNAIELKHLFKRASAETSNNEGPEDIIREKQNDQIKTKNLFSRAGR